MYMSVVLSTGLLDWKVSAFVLVSNGVSVIFYEVFTNYKYRSALFITFEIFRTLFLLIFTGIFLIKFKLILYEDVDFARKKELFTSKITHELRTPLHAICGVLELLTESTPTQDQLDLIEMAATSANGMIQLVNDLLDQSQLQAAKLKISPEFNFIRGTVIGVINQIVTLVRAKDLVLRCVVDVEVPARVFADHRRLSQILLNLFSNSIKFTPDGEEIQFNLFIQASKKLKTITEETGNCCASFLKLDKLSNNIASVVPVESIVDLAVVDKNLLEQNLTLRVEIKDSGCGIAPGKQNELFQQYSQLDSTKPGTGLGLSICKQLVGIMGGELGFYNNNTITPSENGATFWFTLPLNTEVDLIPNDPFDFTIDPTFFSESGPGVTNSSSSVDGSDLTVPTSKDDSPTNYTRKLRKFSFHSSLQHGSSTPTNRFKSFNSEGARTTNLTPTGRLRSFVSEGNPALNLPVGLVIPKTSLDTGRRSSVSVDLTHKKSPQSLDQTLFVENELSAAEASKEHTILIAEDNLMSQQLVARMVQRLGYPFIITGNGRECFDEYSNRHSEIGVILLDGIMPIMSGEETFAKIRQFEDTYNLSHVKVIYTTADADAENQARVRKLGIDTFLSKPFTYLQLQKILNEAKEVIPDASDENTANQPPALSRAKTLINDGKPQGLHDNFRPLRSSTMLPSHHFADFEKEIKNNTATNKHIAFKSDESNSSGKEDSCSPSKSASIPPLATTILAQRAAESSSFSLADNPALSSFITVRNESFALSKTSESKASKDAFSYFSVSKERNKRIESASPVTVDNEDKSTQSFSKADLTSQASSFAGVLPSSRPGSFFNSTSTPKHKEKEQRNSVNSLFNSSPALTTSFGTVLCADDHPMNQKLVSRFLTVLGFAFDIANDGEECFQKYKFSPEKYCAILMDCSMPIKDGYEATIDIRAYEKANNLPRILICALTADNSGDNETKCFASGMDTFLTKPASSKQLAVVLHRPDPEIASREEIEKNAALVARRVSQTPK